MNKNTYWLSISIIIAVILLNANQVFLQYGGTTSATDLTVVYIGFIPIIILTIVYLYDSYKK